MRRKDKEITDPKVIDGLLRSAQVLRLALANGNEPYLVPVSYGYDGSAFYFHTAIEGRKLDFFLANPRVCFELEQGVGLVTDMNDPCNWTMTYRSAIGYGTVRELVGFEDKHEGLLQVMRHYGPGEWSFTPESLAAVRVWRLDVENISTKQSGMKSAV